MNALKNLLRKMGFRFQDTSSEPLNVKISLYDQVTMFTDYILEAPMDEQECEYTIQHMITVLSLLSQRYEDPEMIQGLIVRSFKGSLQHIQHRKLHLH
jgi:hypothetical protein